MTYRRGHDVDRSADAQIAAGSAARETRLGTFRGELEVHALEKPEVALGAIYARVCARARIRSSIFTDNSRAFTTATRADLVVSTRCEG